MITLKKHLILLQIERDKFDAERDRRYAEVNIEREKALKIKEEADKTALALSTETQKYKDEKANELRSQIESERGNYATHEDISALRDYFDALNKPVVEFMASQQGRYGSLRDTKLNVSYLIAGVIALVAIVTLILSLAKKI